MLVPAVGFFGSGRFIGPGRSRTRCGPSKSNREARKDQLEVIKQNSARISSVVDKFNKPLCERPPRNPLKTSVISYFL